MSNIPDNGSVSSASSISSTSSRYHLPTFHIFHTPWMSESWSSVNVRHDRIATGTLRAGMAFLTREMIEMHIQHTPNVRSIADCLPVAGKGKDEGFVGWRQKLGTWPYSKGERPVGRIIGEF